MIARLLFPGFPSLLAEGTQILIAGEPFGVGIAMLPDVRILARWDEDGGGGGMGRERSLYLALVVTAIGGKLPNGLGDLLE
jgi:hypothetical protein